MATATETLKGFTPVKPDVRGARVEREALSNGVIARHIATRYVDTPKAKGFIHTFKTRGGAADGQPFEVWGTSELNDMLKKLRAGVILYLRYGGKERHPDIADAEVHRWDVRDSRHSELTPELRDAVRDNADAQAALETVIAESKRLQAERFEEQRAAARQRGEEPPLHTDDDLPF